MQASHRWQEISISHLSINASLVTAALHRCILLERLTLINCTCTGTLIAAHPLTFPSLHYLSVSSHADGDVTATDGLLLYAFRAPALEVLDIGNPVSFMGIANMLLYSSCTNLTELSFEALALSDGGAPFFKLWLRACPQLQDITVRSVNYPGEGETLINLFRLLTWEPGNTLCTSLIFQWS